MKKNKIGKLIKEERLAKGWTQKELGERAGVSYPLICTLEKDGTASLNTIKKLCKTLEIELEDPNLEEQDAELPLRIGFTVSYWPGPLVWINEQLGEGDFFKKIAFSCYADENEEPVFNAFGQKLINFDPEVHPLFFSGEIKRLVIEEKLDMGFLGSDVLLNEPDIIKVARIMRATEMRHSIAVVLPEDLNITREEIIAAMLNEGNPNYPICTFYYHHNSTAQSEFGRLFMHTTNPHDTLSVRPLRMFKERFKQKILEGKSNMYAYIGVHLTTDAVKTVVQELNDQLLPHQTKWRFETTSSSEVASYTQKNTHAHAVNLGPLYYDVITQRNNKRIKELGRSENFALFFNKLWEAIRVLNLEENKYYPNSLPNNKIADFFKMDKKATSLAMQQADFELVFYPEWVQKAFLLKM